MKKLIILTGGNSLEREISLKSCENVLKYIDKDKYNIKIIIIPENFGENFEWLNQILLFSPDIVFNLLHGADGENGKIQGLLDILSLKYIGSGAISSGLCIDKKLCKDLMKFNKIPVLNDIFISKDDDFFKYKTKIEQMGFPLVAKPNTGGSSVGIELVENMAQVKKAINNIKLLGDDILLEKYINGKEVTCCVMEKEDGLFVLPLIDINIKIGLFDFSAKYNQNGNIDFSNLPNFLKNMVYQIAKKTFKVLKCSGYINIDFIIKEEEIYVLEVNTIPGFTENSLLPKAIEIMGLTFTEFLDNLIEFRLTN